MKHNNNLRCLHRSTPRQSRRLNRKTSRSAASRVTASRSLWLAFRNSREHGENGIIHRVFVRRDHLPSSESLSCSFCNSTAVRSAACQSVQRGRLRSDTPLAHLFKCAAKFRAWRSCSSRSGPPRWSGCICFVFRPGRFRPSDSARRVASAVPGCAKRVRPRRQPCR